MRMMIFVLMIFVHHEDGGVRVDNYGISFVTSLVDSVISNTEFCATWDRFLLHELSENVTFKWHLLERKLTSKM